jgi:hypothetical protein
MNTKILTLIFSVGLAVAMTGCVGTVDGRSQGGMPFVKDRIVGEYQRTTDQVMEAARAVLAFNGTLTAENRINNSLEAKVNQANVFVKVDAIDQDKPVTRVIVQVRAKGGGTDIDLAAELEKEIALKLVR